jgi:hypothetical protein
VPDGVRIVEAVEVLADGIGGDAVILADEIADPLRIGSVGNDLDAIAGGQNHGFAGFGLFDEARQGLAQISGGKRQSFSNFHGGRFVADADDSKLHYGVNACSPLTEKVTRTPTKPAMAR